MPIKILLEASFEKKEKGRRKGKERKIEKERKKEAHMLLTPVIPALWEAEASGSPEVVV